ncbi:pur operon repressor [Lactiplantibacillus mudanjiangensis]|uniref:Purine operon repressor [Lactobacillus plantarum JDM1] n=1 Tax=Lactiplantibacillus mudanjiangensis TaxID=1296538 RepID=A0A660E4K7_9LACO|nr:pur operon repressor [Lactiplantibacillus mudanjiangensis]VDG21414.1 purine operon repressor [Lactobacillus plantarum JDM1] [Lactiplantibacillus mudanjiangensis]VDG26096.1 purine operon repressor [Lactobacillus plantarum JDM1] [Lactiplantibacillus mudanjiangensis]VDG29066.1 purine operon repressor [Lactobacillus plantarum JDM1] [Lactiplantibacillus mudanjiangensis]VDG31583.1 purine operon repressor [Lactobacillus plantarum JDM1] [Lactiplantibacillus mudanjiangensis]
MKVRRSERLIDMTRYLLERPHALVSLTFFAERYESAKSSISEDLTILKRTFQMRGTGILETIPGAAGGARFIPYILKEEAQTFIDEMTDLVADKSRVLPGGYIYLSDILGQPEILRQVGRVIATQYLNQKIDAVMTVATKGIPIAQSVATYLNVPFVIVRNDSKITEGSTVSVNYVSGSSERIKKMELSKRSLSEGANVLIVDDFMKGGGTINGMKTLIEEFDANLIGITVFAEAAFTGNRLIDDYTSLLRVTNVNDNEKAIKVVPGNYLETVFGAEV